MSKKLRERIIKEKMQKEEQNEMQMVKNKIVFNLF